jgi:hypothetical protein
MDFIQQVIHEFSIGGSQYKESIREYIQKPGVPFVKELEQVLSNETSSLQKHEILLRCLARGKKASQEKRVIITTTVQR